MNIPPKLSAVSILLLASVFLANCGGNPTPSQRAANNPPSSASGGSGSGGSGSGSSGSGGSGSGQGTTGQLTVSPVSLNFGNVPVGQSASQAGSLTAAGAAVVVSSADWSGPGFAVSGISFPVTIAAGQSIPFNVTFTPDASGQAAGSISFFSNASDSPGTESLSGAGTGTTQTYTVSLSWDASTSPVSGYNVYRGTISGGPYNKLTPAPQPQTSYADGTAQGGMTYYYVATSIGTDGKESAYSNQTVAVIP